MALSKRRKTGRVTLAQVAEYIGVTSMTVSRALRTPEAVSEEMKNKVDLAVKELGYMPNQMAGALASAKSRIIAIVTPPVTGSAWQRALGFLQQHLQQEGYTVFYSTVPYSEKAEKHINQLMQLSPAALVTAALAIPDNCRELLKKNNIPFIEMLDIDAPSALNRVGMSNRQAAIDLTNHLISRGYKKIGFIGCRSRSIEFQQRVKGWRESMMSHYLVPDILVTDLAEPGFTLAANLFSKMRDSWNEVDSVICGDSLLATGLLFECQRQFLSIPQHLALATFDERQLSCGVHPAITSITIPLQDIAEKTSQLLLEKMAQKNTEGVCLDVGYTLDIRSTT